MKIIQIEQGCREWLALREDKITSSDASSIMGTNPFCDIFKLWQRKHKMIPPEPMNDRMLRGQKLEDPARLLLNETLDIDFKPAVGLHDQDDWCMTSLDGLSPCGEFICEIKAPGLDTHNLAIQGDIRPYYYTQVQHHLHASKAKICFYCSYFPGHEKELVILRYEIDNEYVNDLIPKENYFYEKNILMMERPQQVKLFQVKNKYSNVKLSTKP